MNFGTWYQINCENEDQWPGDFQRIHDAGFDFVVLWHMCLHPEVAAPGDFRRIVTESEKTKRALDGVQQSGLQAYLGIWHPYYMGPVPTAWRPKWNDGRNGQGPNIYNPDWIRKSWQPYVQAAGRLCVSYPACRGVYLDDTFPAVPENLHRILGYSASDKRRFREWLSQRYGDVESLNLSHKFNPGYRSFAAIRAPREPMENLPLWSDWMEARAEWCEYFACRTREALRAGARGNACELVLSDFDYHLFCTPLQYGVDYSRLMRHVDRFELGTLMVGNHRKGGPRAALHDVRRIIRRGRSIAAGRPYQFHTWFANYITNEPMAPQLLADVIACAADEGADTMEIYTFKVHDWRVASADARNGRPAFRELSMKYNPTILRTVSRTIGRLKARK